MDINLGVTRATDHADRRADTIVKSLGAVEQRLEDLSDKKANRSEIVLARDLDKILGKQVGEWEQRWERGGKGRGGEEKGR